MFTSKHYNFKKTLIGKLLHKTKHKIESQSVTSNSLPISTSSTENSQKFVSLTYIKGLSDTINKTIKQTNQNISIAFKPHNNIKHNFFTNNKQKVEIKDQSAVVYKINCSTCDAVYIGETSKKLDTRINRHKYDLSTIHKDNPKTSLITHTRQTGHIFKYDEAQIIDQEKNRSKRTLLEATHILLNSPNSVNIKNDVRKINENYLKPLNIYKQNSPLHKK